jgi:excisionase family DNA binding protein
MLFETDVLSVNEFCRRHDICRATFYNLLKAGRGPAFMKVGSRVLISREAAEQWRRAMEPAPRIERIAAPGRRNHVERDITGGEEMRLRPVSSDTESVEITDPGRGGT